MRRDETIRRASVVFAGVVAGMLSGCGGASFSNTSAPVAVAGVHLSGKTFGGQQPITGATIAVYVAATTGYSGPTHNILNVAVTTGAGGSFDLPAGSYSCTAARGGSRCTSRRLGVIPESDNRTRMWP